MSLSAAVAVAVLWALGATGKGDMPIAPGTVISDGEYEGFESVLHVHPHEGFQPCLILGNEDDELHAFLSPAGNWEVSLVIVVKGSLSPIKGIGIGASLAELPDLEDGL